MAKATSNLPDVYACMPTETASTSTSITIAFDTNGLPSVAPGLIKVGTWCIGIFFFAKSGNSWDRLNPDN